MKNRKIMIAVMVFVVIFCAAGDRHGEADTEAVDVLQTAEEEVVSWEEEKAGLTEEEQEQRLEEIKKEAEKAGVPERIISLIDQNDEIVDFVRDYPEKHDNEPVETIGTEWKDGEIPQLLQWDERWGYMPYGKGTIANCGCGPTCVSMVIAGLTGDMSVTPYMAAKYSEEHGLIDENDNTYWQFLEAMPREYGIEVYETFMNEELVKQELSEGHPIICSVGAGDFTDDGHFIVLTEYNDGEVTVNDPFSQVRSDRKWVYAEIENQINEMWIYKK